MNTTKRTSIVLLSLSLVFFTVGVVIIFLLSNDAVANSISNWRAGSDKNILWHIKNEGYADNKSGYTGFMVYVIIAMFLKVFIAITGITLIVNSSKENNKIGIFAGITGIVFVPLGVIFAGITLAQKTKHSEEVVEEQPIPAENASPESKDVVESSTSIKEEIVATPEEIKEKPEIVVEGVQNVEGETNQVNESEPIKKSWWKDKKKKKENETPIEDATTNTEVTEAAKPEVEVKEAKTEVSTEITKEESSVPVIPAPAEKSTKKEKAVKPKITETIEQPKTNEAIVPPVVPVEKTQSTPEVPAQPVEVPAQPVQETPAPAVPVEIQNQQQVPLEQYQDPTQQDVNTFVDSPESIQAMSALGNERTKSIEVFAADLIPKINPNATEEQISQTITQQLFVKQIVGYDPNKESPEQVLSMVQKVVDNVVKKFVSSPEKKVGTPAVARAPQTQSQTRRPMMTQPKRR